MSEFEVPTDLDKRLQRQLLEMDPAEAQAYAGLVSNVLEKLLEAAKGAAPSREEDSKTLRAS